MPDSLTGLYMLMLAVFRTDGELALIAFLAWLCLAACVKHHVQPAQCAEIWSYLTLLGLHLPDYRYTQVQSSTASFTSACHTCHEATGLQLAIVLLSVGCYDLPSSSYLNCIVSQPLASAVQQLSSNLGKLPA